MRIDPNSFSFPEKIVINKLEDFDNIEETVTKNITEISIFIDIFKQDHLPYNKKFS